MYQRFIKARNGVNMAKVFIDGSEGTTGLRIFERFESRDDIEILKIPRESRKDPEVIKKFINESDITFLCLPDDAAREAAEMCENESTVIIDASTAHRTEPGWAYGFPELSDAHRQAIAEGKRIAVPGCYASGFVSLVYPLVKGGILPQDYPVSCFAVSGYSGGGKKLIAQYEDKERDSKYSSARLYAWTQSHKHLKEMKKIPGLVREPLFSPLTTDYHSGMVVQVPLYRDLLTTRPSLEELRAFFRDFYKGSRFVHIAEDSAIDDKGNVIFSSEMAGRDDMVIYIAGNEERFVLASSFDNLGKGASGAAVQCMNIVLGMDEATGLNIV